MGDARDGTLSGSKGIVRELHVKWGRASAQQIKRVLVGAEGGISYLPLHVDEVRGHRDVGRAFDGAPHVPIVGTSTLSMSNEQVQDDLLFLDNIVALRVVDVPSMYSLFTPARSKNPRGVWATFANLWIGIFGPPKRIRMDEGGE